jgi:hypothetical protein
VDNTSKELFETCSRAAEYYSRERREAAGVKAALHYGGAIHKGLVPRKEYQLGIAKLSCPLPENWTTTGEQAILDEFYKHPSSLEEWRTLDHCIGLFHRYNKTYPVEAEPFLVMPGTIEMPFKIPIGTADLDCSLLAWVADSPFDPKTVPKCTKKLIYIRTLRLFWTGRIDLIIKFGPTLFVMDHKTSSILGPTFYDDFILSSQMMGYTWAGRKLGYDVRGLYLDVLGSRKPTKSGIQFEFQRQRFFYAQDHLDEWERDTFTLITDFLEHLCRDYFPKTTKWCFGKYGRCQYWNVCTQLPDQRQALLESAAYQDVEWSPLNETNGEVV